MENARKRKIKLSILQWVNQGEISQKELAEALNISAPSLSKMLSGAAPLPITRFLQIVNVLHPSQDEINKVWQLYLDELGLSATILKLTLAYNAPKDLRSKMHALIDVIPLEQLAVLEPLLENMAQKYNHKNGDANDE